MMRLNQCKVNDMLVIYPTPSQFRCASMWLAEQTKSFGLPDEEIYKLDICLNETLANILEHGGKDAESAPITLQLKHHIQSNCGEATLKIIAAGVEFDPFSATSPPKANTLEDTTPGGLGLFMLHQFSDHQSYQYLEGRNHLSFTVHWSII